MFEQLTQNSTYVRVIEPFPCFNILSLEVEDLVNLVEKYRQREYCEDIEYLENELRGNHSFIDAMARLSRSSGRY